MEKEARELNIGFISRMTRHRPWMRLKVAASLDGKTALLNGRSQWITGPVARRDGHHWRARACAVLTGIGTVKDDDPQLTVRHVKTPRQPTRIVVDSRLETAASARVLGPGTLIAAARREPERASRLEAKGAEVIALPNDSGKVDLAALLRELGRRGMNEVHVEAGYKLNGSLLREGLIDELVIYFAPLFLGDSARGMFSLPPLEELSQGYALEVREVTRLGEDIRVIARLKA
jgi:diaminohydroxyphosphoribosylaminopyrimidine deaminase/5-amino-6-(5-phosphoribosylamino)uracil reductase